MLEGRADKQGECWIWHPTPGENRFQCTWQGRHLGIMHLLASLTGVALPSRSRMAPLCSNARCVKPSHFAVEPASAPNPTGRKGYLTPEQVLAIFASTDGVRVIADRYGCAVNTVRAIKNGRAHRDLTGLPKPERRS